MNIHMRRLLIWLFFLLFFITFILYKNNLEIDFVDFIFNGIKVIILVIGVNVVHKFKIKYFTLGVSLLAIGMLLNGIKKFNAYSVIDQFDYYLGLFYNIFVIIGIVLILKGMIDILFEKNALIKKLSYMAYHDVLTGLPNRNDITNLNKTLKNYKELTLLFIDLDDFKLVNDNLGHYSGDKVLKIVAHRLKSIIKGEDIVARISGDEFLVVLRNPESVKNTNDIAIKIQISISEPMTIMNKTIHIYSSIGISQYPVDGRDFDTLIKNADLAMYRAKKSGKNQIYTYNTRLSKEYSKRFKFQEEIKVAIKKKEFILHYQPKINVKSGEIMGVEALIRWCHPELGMVYPGAFIPIAEETELIRKIDLQVIELACLQIRSWIDSGLTPFNIAVNISPILFKNQSFVGNIDQIISKYNIEPSLLTFEITENIAIENMSQTIHILEQIKERQIQIAIDDFGKGFSSLIYIKDFPIDILKLDKVFIDQVLQNNKTQAVFETIISFSKKINVKVVSEGVESPSQLEFLKQLECDEYQGFLHSKPMPIDELNRFIRMTKH